jgi:hypothetical protein
MVNDNAATTKDFIFVPQILKRTHQQKCIRYIYSPEFFSSCCVTATFHIPCAPLGVQYLIKITKKNKKKKQENLSWLLFLLPYGSTRRKIFVTPLSGF